MENPLQNTKRVAYGLPVINIYSGWARVLAAKDPVKLEFIPQIWEQERLKIDDKSIVCLVARGKAYYKGSYVKQIDILIGKMYEEDQKLTVFLKSIEQIAPTFVPYIFDVLELTDKLNALSDDLDFKLELTTSTQQNSDGLLVPEKFRLVKPRRN